MNIKYPICFYPEGTVSNGNQILKFKTGAFKYNQAKIQPIIIQINSLFKMTGHQNPVILIFKLFYNPFIIMEITYLRQQESNQFQNESDYADTMRYIMCKRSGLQLSNYGLNDMLYFFKDKNIDNTYVQQQYSNIRWKQYKQICRKLKLEKWYSYSYQQLNQDSFTSQK